MPIVIQNAAQKETIYSYLQFPEIVEGEDYSIDVLIDVYGNGKLYIVGFYHFARKEWMGECNDIPETMRWKYIYF